MTCRRKTISERKLVADYLKIFGSFCNTYKSCSQCKYGNKDCYCEIEYFKDLLKLNKESKDE